MVRGGSEESIRERESTVRETITGGKKEMEFSELLNYFK
jgi:hypothetical protein